MKKLLLIILAFICLIGTVNANNNHNGNKKTFSLCKKEHRYKKTNFNVPYFARKHKHFKR